MVIIEENEKHIYTNKECEIVALKQLDKSNETEFKLTVGDFIRQEGAYVPGINHLIYDKEYIESDLARRCLKLISDHYNMEIVIKYK